MNKKDTNTAKVLVSSLPSDSHTWNLVYMQMWLEERGYQVKNAGNCVSTAHLLELCNKFKPSLVVISTINGHGYIEAVELIKQISANESLSNIKVVIGGKLATTTDQEESFMQNLLTAGFHKVFVGEKAINDFEIFLEEGISPAFKGEVAEAA